MEFLKNITAFTFVLLTLFIQNTSAAIEGLVLREGLEAEIIYDGSEQGSGAERIVLTEQMAIDPQTGDLYFSNTVPEGENNILILNPDTGEISKFPFFGPGLGFNKDGSILYFALDKIMLGVWYREQNEYRKFSNIPKVVSVQVVDDGTAKGKLLVANDDKAKKILYTDGVYEVDQGDGFYAPVLTYSEASIELDKGFNTLVHMAVDDKGNIFTTNGQGKMVIQKSDGSYMEGNSALRGISGVMDGGLTVDPNGMVYQLDTREGEVFALYDNGSEIKQVMLAFGEPLEGNNSQASMASDGNSLYLVNDKGMVIRIYPTDSSASLKTTALTDLGQSTISGTITQVVGEDEEGMPILAPLPGVEVKLRDPSIAATVTDSNGNYSLSVPAGLYHVFTSINNFGNEHETVAASTSSPAVYNETPSSFLPGFLAPGLEAEIIATNSQDKTEGSSDITFDNEGNVYSLNHGNGTITKTVLDSDTREVIETFVAASGGGLGNAWSVAIGNDLNMYASSSNSGLLRLPPADPENEFRLTVDPDDALIVRDQNGVDRMVSFVTDIDGITTLNDGTIMMTSGTGGSIIDGFPEGTINAIISYNPETGAQELFSRGLPPGGGETTLFNPDILKSDNNDTLYVTNKSGNLVSIDTDGFGYTHWRGDGEGYPEGLSSYTAFAADNFGGLFLKGISDNGKSELRMIDPSDDHNLLVVASQLSESSGFGGFELDADGKSVVLSEWDFVLRIKTKDGRTIAENLVNPPPDAVATINYKPYIQNIDRTGNRKKEEFTLFDPKSVKLPELWFYETSPTVENNTETNIEANTSSGGGVIYWMILLGLILVLAGKRRIY